MRTSNYWEQFLSTGRIKDYLAYREDEGEPEQSEGAGRGEGSDQCYRDDIKNGTCGGI
jgi:hypothetical protein